MVVLFYVRVYTASVSCAVDGNIRLRPKDGQVMDTSNYHLLQVCLFGQWNYVCDIIDFSRFDLSVTLHQLGYTGGGTCHAFVYVFSLIILTHLHLFTIQNTRLSFS